MQQRDYSLDILRGFAILLVIFGHIQRLGGVVTDYIWSFHLPLFFFISGMLFRPEKYKNIRTFLKSKTVGIILPYILFYLISYAYWILIERHMRGGDISPLQYLIGLPYGTYDVRFNNFNGALWFLPALFTTEVLYYLIQKLKSYTHIILALVSLYVIGYVFRNQLQYVPWGMNVAMLCVCFYGFGHLFVQSGLYVNLTALEPGKKGFLALVMAATHILLLPYTGVDLCIEKIDHPLAFIPIALVGITGYLSVATLIKHNIILEWMGRSSLVLFAFHSQIFRIILFVESKLAHISVDDVRNNVIFCLVCLVVTILLIWPINYCYVKWISPWFKTLCSPQLYIRKNYS